MIDVDHDRDAITAAIQEHVKRGHPNADHLYGDGRAGIRIADCLVSTQFKIEKMLTY